MFFPYRISERLVGKQPERFPGSGKPQFFFGSKKHKVGPQTKIRWNHKCQAFFWSFIDWLHVRSTFGVSTGGDSIEGGCEFGFTQSGVMLRAALP